MNKSDKGCRQGKYTEYIGGTYFKQSQENVNQRANHKDAYVDINQLDEIFPLLNVSFKSAIICPIVIAFFSPIQNQD